MDADPDCPALALLSAMSDQTLAERAQGGSMQCFVELVGRFEARIYNFLLRRVGHPVDAEDLTQETFLRAWQAIGRYRSKATLSTWLFTIAGRLAIDHARRRRRINDMQSGRTDMEQVSADSSHVEAVQQAGRELWDLAAAVLPDEQHAAVWLRYAENMSSADVARALGRSHVSVRVMLMRARHTLAAHASPHLLAMDGANAVNVIASPVEGGIPCSAR
jgi:RNA polymerase sigma-70 factor (ECF subfamily)